MQITTLIIAPTFFAAALYVLLGRLVDVIGRETSLVRPRVYTVVFCTCDVVSLVVQAVGGAMASIAADEPDGDTATGTHIMVGGIIFQMATMTVYAGFVFDFLRRVFLRQRAYLSAGGGGGGGNGGGGGGGGGNLTTPVKKVLAALFISFVMIYIRSVYRTIELLEGWDGYLITNEGFFFGLDAALMVIAVAVFLVWDPAVLLPRTRKEPVGKNGASDSESGEATEMENTRLAPV